MRESGHFVADYQIVQPLTENSLYESYQVTGAGVDSAILLLISVEQLVDKKARQAFLEQVQLLLGQSFPGLCCLLAADTNDLQSYCLYPVPAGTPLTEQLTEQFTARRSLELVRKLAVQLGSAHAAELWHGAVSPATIYLDGEAVSLDQFALASLLPLDFHSGVDPCYSSPELVRGEPLSAAADLYSLGIVLYRLLTGKVPFSADEPFATAMLHVQEQPALLPQGLAVLQPLVDGLLQAAPGERWTAEQLVAEIDRVLLLPEFDSLTAALEVEPASEDRGPENNVDPDAVEAAKFEELMSKSDLTARIEQRLQERAADLKASEPLSGDAKRASTERMSAISQQSYRESKDMKYNRQQKSGTGRLTVLIAVGIAVGVIIYLVLFGGLAGSPQQAAQLPEKLVAGLDAGSQQLKQGNVSGAETTFSGLIEDFALYPQPYNNLAAVYAQQGKLEQARDVLERAMATEEAYAVIYRNLGAVYSEMARDSYGRALQLEKAQQAVTLQLFGGRELLAVNTAKTKPAPVVAAGAKPVVESAQEQVSAAQETADEQLPINDPQSQVSSAPGEIVATVAETLLEMTSDAAEPVTEVIMEAEPASAEEILRRWAAAWSAQDVQSYLRFYAAEFIPPAGNSRETWEKQRESRLTKPKSIEVTMSDFALIEQDGNRMQLEVTQGYKSDRYSDQTRKLFDLVLVGENWRIVRERSLGRVR